ncbi:MULTISPECIES: ABC transporter ATP-binding protein [unclassified Rathayibacter]|uniref:ABC transporter ATP-binding protein n=1 Tax=unclassified Rathayibacter TaxID=2609250 RepID=UPI000CE7C995|nr:MULTISPECIES: ABC transporter ATP-binding protein [unclassified Rathayibacter]PPG52497.1 ABC transporter ATP-binding protein [Rathayibacter sp. AY2B3]PPI26658.1 ABC transporter ATP-binding protein [Rathayibacter sp. AY1B5]
MIPMLQARAVGQTVAAGRRTTTVLRGCDIHLEGGGLAAVVGSSGSGKTSLLMCLSGLDRPTTGTVEVNGRDVYRLSAAERSRMLRTEIGFVFQQYNLVPFLDVEENIALPFRLDRSPVPHDRIRGLVEAFGLGDRRHAPARTLSGGEQQRTALCRALARRPSIVFADEPTGALDSHSSQIVLSTLRSMADEGRMVVMVTHDLEAAALADTVVVMHDGGTVRTTGRRTSHELLSILEEARS